MSGEKVFFDSEQRNRRGVCHWFGRLSKRRKNIKINERVNSLFTFLTTLVPLTTVGRSFSCQLTFVKLRDVFGQFRGQSHVVDIDFFVDRR